MNFILWNGGEVKYDIRDWNNDYFCLSKGIILILEELKNLRDLFIIELVDK